MSDIKIEIQEDTAQVPKERMFMYVYRPEDRVNGLYYFVIRINKYTNEFVAELACTSKTFYGYIPSAMRFVEHVMPEANIHNVPGGMMKYFTTIHSQVNNERFFGMYRKINNDKTE